ncbi:MAG TPA: hypothetical protein VJQ43_01885 [Thermoplasmata archaeon]|nr:hypothetical protein [Thermoplasmata archaeon]
MNPPRAAPATSRYAYLVSRLRSRQITMEEATELFALQQTMIAHASVPDRPSSPPEDSPTEPPPPSAPGPGGMAPGAFSDENIAMGLLAMGAGAGLLAAVVKRAQEGPKPSQ